MLIRLADSKDLQAALLIIDEAKAFLKAQNINQWQDGYPDIAALNEDIFKKRLYVVEEGKELIALFALVEKEATYEYIEGSWHYDQTYLAIHRVAVKNSFKGHGIAHKIFAYAAQKCPYLRIDTHKDNLLMQKSVQKFGFQYCGIIYLADGNPRLAYDYHQ